MNVSRNPGVLRRNPAFRRVWTAATVGSAGGQVTLVAVPLLAAIGLHASPAVLGYLAAAGSIPYLLLALPVGVWVDRSTHPRRLVVRCDLTSAATLAVIPAAAAAAVVSLPLLAAVAFAAGVTRVITTTASARVVPAVLPPTDRLAGSARMNTSFAAAQIGGPAVGALLVHALTAPYAVTVDAVSFLASAWAMHGVPEVPPTRPLQPRVSVLGDLSDGITTLTRDRTLRALTAAAAIFNVALSGLLTLAVLVVLHTLRLPAGAYGLTLLVVGVGALVGATAVGPVGTRFGLGPTAIAAGTVAAVGMAGWAGAADPSTAARVAVGVGSFLLGAGAVAEFVCAETLLQLLVPDTLRGRVAATDSFFVQGARPVGALLGGFLGGALGLHPTLLVLTAIAALSPLLLLASPLRHRESGSQRHAGQADR